MKTLLFVCTGNTERSVVAEFYARRLFPRMYRIVSAGTAANAGERAGKDAIEYLKFLGIKAKSHRSQQVTPELLQEATLVICMTEKQKTLLSDLAEGLLMDTKKIVRLREIAQDNRAKDIDDMGLSVLPLVRICLDVAKEAIIQKMKG